ncbi:hypothetical protein BFO_2084 [Tannerella forsythia 92A2]|uniref:Uncharacterized protein n=1 Tax=Tannerella forsythia (strain ATCC 43037 / JCM 10827 / CCUG 21028 A / KCTC 5666 / FDC 338) TaxID=203275 RepID=G8UHV8_TANFA|nr:hypothetical protein BFO_2084 [Tannerella forsythia 92A2]
MILLVKRKLFKNGCPFQYRKRLPFLRKNDSCCPIKETSLL